MAELSLDEARRRWSAAQGLDRRRCEPVAATLERTGWVRTLGGLAGYLALSARNDTATPSTVHEAVRSKDIGVSPAVRGCIYLVPRSHQPLALRLARHLSARRRARERDKLDLPPEELDRVGEAVVRALADSALTTTALRRRLPEGTIRSLGPAGKKLGVTSTLPPALRRLEFAGRIARTPVETRLDHERYAWSLADLEVGTFTEEDAATLATLYLSWAGPSTRKELAAWSGLKQSASKGALAAAGAEAHQLAGEEVFLPPDAPPLPEATGAVRWLPGMDNLYGLRADARHLVDPAHAEVEVTRFGSRPRGVLGRVSQPIERTIVRDGQVIGLWAYDPADDALVSSLAPDQPDDDDAHDAERERIRDTISALGHGKVFSLDKDAKLTARADRLRSLAWTN